MSQRIEYRIVYESFFKSEPARIWARTLDPAHIKAHIDDCNRCVAVKRIGIERVTVTE